MTESKNNQTAESELFKISANAYIRKLTSAWIANYWYIFVMPLLAIAVWSFYDLRALYVGLIVLFLIYPAALSFVWFNYAFSPKSIKAIRPKRVIIEGNKLVANYFDDSDALVACAHDYILADSVIAVSQDSEYVTLTVGRKIDDIFMIPINYFTQHQLSDFLASYCQLQTLA